jgi:hypothetical protein
MLAFVQTPVLPEAHPVGRLSALLCRSPDEPVSPLRMPLVLRRPTTGCLSVGLAHIRAPLRVAVVAGSGEVIDVRVLVDPNDCRSGAAGLSFLR